MAVFAPLALPGRKPELLLELEPTLGAALEPGPELILWLEVSLGR